MRFFGYKHWTLEEVPRCFYVGKGVKHRSHSKSRNHKWHAVVKRYGLRVEIDVGPISNKEACAWEIENIQLMKTFSTCHDHDNINDIGCNFTLGGEGTLGHKRTEKTKKLDRRPKPWRSGQNHPLYGKPAHNRGQTITEDLRIKHSKSHRNYKFSDERKQRHSERFRGENNPMFGCKRNPTWGKKGWRTRRLNKKRKEMGQQILFLVGPDRCGKSNIAAAISAVTGIKTFKAKSEHHTFLTDQSAFLNDLRYADPRVCDFLTQTWASVLFDRGFPCEWVYSQFYNRKTDYNVLKFIDNEYQKIDAKIIICKRSSFDGIQDDLDPKLNSEALMKIQGLYEDFARWTKCKTMSLNVDDENLVREVTEILKFLGYKGDELNSLIDEAIEYDARRRSTGICC